MGRATRTGESADGDGRVDRTVAGRLAGRGGAAGSGGEKHGLLTSPARIAPGRLVPRRGGYAPPKARQRVAIDGVSDARPDYRPIRSGEAAPYGTSRRPPGCLPDQS